MIVTLRTERIRALDQIRAFLEGSEPTDFRFAGRDSAYDFVRRTLVRFEFHGLKRDEKGLVKRFLEKVTGYSRAQITRLVKQYHRSGGIRDHRRKPPAKPFPRRYTPGDAALLAEVDEAFGQLSGPATKAVLWRMRHVHGDERFERLAGISNGHIYNLRRFRIYRTGRLSFRETRATPVGFGVRRRPRPDGRPGFLRVDTVHLGDLEGRKGAYVINIVDEVTQFQHLGAVRRITQQFMVPVLKDLISAFPFTVQAFHADNGSEYINREVADLLSRLHVPTFTKFRPRRSNDNALVESKNGSIVRRWLGHVHVPHELVPSLDTFLRDSLCPLPQLPPALPLPHRGDERQRPRHKDLPAGQCRHPLPALPIAARRPRTPPARCHLRCPRPNRFRHHRPRRRQGRPTRPRRPLPCDRPSQRLRRMTPSRRPQAPRRPSRISRNRSPSGCLSPPSTG